MREHPEPTSSHGPGRATLACATTLTLMVALAGCGDDGSGPPDAGGDGSVPGDAGGDAALDASSDAGVDGSADAGVDAGPPPCEPNRLLVTTSDFMTGGLGLLDPSDDTAMVASLPLPDQDSVPALAGCLPALLERGNGNLLLQNADDPFTTDGAVNLNPAGVMGPYAVNPQALVTVDDRAYVAALGSNEVPVVDLTTAEVAGRVDLSSLAAAGDMDGLVDQVGVAAVGGEVWVALARYWFDDSFAIHFEGSVLARIDTTDDSLAGTVELTGNNPWRGMWLDETAGVLLVGSAGDSFALDGGIEAVDVGAGTSLGLVLEETTLDAELNGFAVVDDTRAYVLAGTDVRVWDRADTVDAEPVASGVDGMVLHDGALYTWSRSGEGAGMRRFDAATGAETTPAAGPWTFGDLPISAVAESP